jgi:AraC-like DNA-binding protein
MNNFFEEKLTYNQIAFRYAKGKSLVSGNEIHPYHEILYYIDGGATFLSEDFQEELSGGTLLIIPKESYHNFHIKNQENYIRLTISFPNIESINDLILSTMTQIKIIKNINSHMLYILNRMSRIIRSEKTDEASVFLYGAYLMLLAEIGLEDAEAVSPRLRDSDHLVSRCIQHIDKNLTSDLRIETIAKEMHISTSTLFHCFKRTLGISLHKYIIEKRLIYARKLIEKGGNPTKIYLECGYNDYSSFYKAYLKMFGHPPSVDKNG